jgi:hypothetical protein
MTTEHEPHEPRPTRQLDEELGEVSFFGEPWTLRVKAALLDEPYRRSLRSEIVPLTAERGTRTVVHAQPYIIVPHITLEVAPTAHPTGGQLGEVTDSRWEGMRPEYIGQCQGWYYHEDRTLVVWEALLEDRYQTGEAPDDANLRLLWQGFEAFLLRQFPDAQQLVTTPDDPLYEVADYQRFLKSLGYQPLSPQAFGKRRS